MKATNRSVFHSLVVERIPIPEIYRVKQRDHDRYKWITQKDQVIPIKEMDDMHLMNTYRMLANTILYAKDLRKHRLLTSPLQRVVTHCHYHMQYIGYELYERQGSANPKSTNKSLEDGAF